MAQRENKFPNYRCYDKLTDNNAKARLTVMVHEEIKVERMTQYEDLVNPMICLRINS